MDAVGKLQAIDEIRQLKSRYFRFLDTKDWSGMATIFCADAVFDLRAGAQDGPNGTLGGPENILHGREQILEFFAASMPGTVSVHHGHGHEITLETAEKARGIVAMEDLIYREDNGALRLHGYGHYHEVYAREDGQWRIAQSRLSRLKATLGPGEG
jgi:SnoaL-like domain